MYIRFDSPDMDFELEFQIHHFVISIFPQIFFIKISFVLSAAEATGLGFVCFVVINPCVLSANRAWFWAFFVSWIFQFYLIFQLLPPPPQSEQKLLSMRDSLHITEVEYQNTVASYNGFIDSATADVMSFSDVIGLLCLSIISNSHSSSLQ